MIHSNEIDKIENRNEECFKETNNPQKSIEQGNRIHD